jgi:hypothetical protein
VKKDGSVQVDHMPRVWDYSKSAAARQRKNELQGPSMAAAFEHILQTVAPSLEVLEVDLEYYTSIQLSQVIYFPSLTDLTSHGAYPLSSSCTSLLTPCHNLRRLHIANNPQENSELCV